MHGEKDDWTDRLFLFFSALRTLSSCGTQKSGALGVLTRAKRKKERHWLMFKVQSGGVRVEAGALISFFAGRGQKVEDSGSDWTNGSLKGKSTGHLRPRYYCVRLRSYSMQRAVRCVCELRPAGPWKFALRLLPVDILTAAAWRFLLHSQLSWCTEAEGISARHSDRKRPKKKKKK